MKPQPSVSSKDLNLSNETHNNAPVFRLRDMFRPSFDLWLFSWVLGIIFALSIVALLMISGWFITSAALAGMIAVGSHTFNYMLPAAAIRVTAIARTASRYGELMISHNAVFDLLKTLRIRFFNRLAALPLVKQRHALHASQYMHRLVSDIDRLDEFILRVVSPWIVSSITVTLLGAFIALVLPISSNLKLIIIVLLALSLIVPFAGALLGIKQANELAEVSEARRHKLLAPLAIITQLLLWQQWYSQTKDYINQDDELQQREWQAQLQRSLYMLIIQWLFYACIVIVLLGVANMASHPTLNSDVNIPLVLAVALGLLGIQEIVVPLGQHYLSFGNSVAAKNRLNALLSQPVNDQQNNSTINTIADTELSCVQASSLPLPQGALKLQLNQVYAKIPKALVGAQNVNVTIHSGKPLIVKGPSGCGKSTLLQMLAGELSLLAGEVNLNGENWQRYDWQDQLGYLGQQLDIFDQSLAANLRLGKPDASNEQLLEVLDRVALSEWLQAQPQGLDTPLGEYGAAISGGQARRIALARLMLKPRRMLLLDEPFAGLDTKTRSHVWESVQQHQKNDLLIVVSHHQWDMSNVDTLTLDEGVFINQ